MSGRLLALVTNMRVVSTPMHEGFGEMANQIAALAPAGRQAEPENSLQR